MALTFNERIAVVIEDDDDIRGLLEITLRQAGFAVHAAATGEDGVALARHHRPVVTTVDISLPDIDGFEVTRRLRTFSDAFVVMLTARAEEIDTLMGLDAGADDYVTKPFRPRELRARIEALLRRATRVHPARAEHAPAPPPEPAAATPTTTAAPTVAEDDHVLSHNGLRLDPHTRSVDVEGRPVPLTRSEFDLLAALLAAGGRVLSKDQLVRRLWAEEYHTGAPVSEADRRSLEVHLGNLRRKIGDSTGAPRFVETVRGVGYRRAAGQ